MPHRLTLIGITPEQAPDYVIGLNIPLSHALKFSAAAAIPRGAIEVTQLENPNPNNAPTQSITFSYTVA